MLYGVPASLDVGSSGPGGESGLGDLHGGLFVLDALLQELNVLLHVKDLLQNLPGRKPTLKVKHTGKKK